jgi:hypothetical protein
MTEQVITTLPLLDFPDAVRAVTRGERVTKLAWGDDKIYLSLWNGFLSIHRPGQTPGALLVSDGDLAGDDWVIL